MGIFRLILRAITLVCVMLAAPTGATETSVYTYDALGRVVTSTISGTVNNGQTTTIALDPAGNRTSYAVSGVAPPQVISIGNASATEGSDLVFTVTRSGTTTGAASVNWATANGTAIAGTDYTAGSGVVNFAAGETSKPITVATIDDIEGGGSKTMSVVLSNPTGGASLGTSTGTGTILDNDGGFADLAIGNASGAEGTDLIFSVTRSGNTSTAVSANYATASGTAISGTDFTPSSGTINFASGETSKPISVTTIENTTLEGSKTFSVTLSSASSGAQITTATGTGTILDNEAGIAISNASGDEGTNLVFTVTRSGNTASAVSVDYATASGTAISGTDFTPTSGTLDFAATETTKPISVTTIDNTISGGSKTFTVNLSNPSANATITGATGTGTINDNDALWTSSLTAGSNGLGGSKRTGYNEGSFGTLSPSVWGSFTVKRLWAVQNGSVVFILSGTSTPPNSGWTSITLPGIGTLNRSNASYSSNSSDGTWTWSVASPAIATSGTVVIQ